MPAAKYDLEIDQGSSFALAITVSEGGLPRNLTNYNARASMRPTINSPDTDVINFSFNLTNKSNGVIVMELAHTASTAMTPGTYVYDLEIYQGNEGQETEVTRLMQGKVKLSAEVTR